MGTNTPGGEYCCTTGCLSCSFNAVGGQSNSFTCLDLVCPAYTGKTNTPGGESCCTTGCLSCELNAVGGQSNTLTCLDPAVGDYCDGMGASCGGYQGYTCSNTEEQVLVDDYRYYSASQCTTFFPMGSAAGTPSACGTLTVTPGQIAGQVTTSRGVCELPAPISGNTCVDKPIPGYSHSCADLSSLLKEPNGYCTRIPVAAACCCCADGVANANGDCQSD